MTKQQLVAQLGARTVPRHTISSPARESRLGLDFDLNSLKFRAYFFVDEAFGLETIRLVCQSSDYTTLADFKRLENDLTQKYGSPQKRKVDVKSGTIASTTWLAGSTSIELDFIDTNIRVGEKLTHVKGLDITYKRVGVDKL